MSKITIDSCELIISGNSCKMKDAKGVTVILENDNLVGKTTCPDEKVNAKGLTSQSFNLGGIRVISKYFSKKSILIDLLFERCCRCDGFEGIFEIFSSGNNDISINLIKFRCEKEAFRAIVLLHGTEIDGHALEFKLYHFLIKEVRKII